MKNRRKIKKKEWLKNRQKKIMRQRQRKNRKDSAKGHLKTINKHKHIKEHKVRLPSIFSLLKNEGETTAFFSEVFSVVNSCSIYEKIFFDLSEIQIVTTDAIMYLIAVICNNKRMQSFKIVCSGNMPVNNQARNMFNKVGFYNYVQSTDKIRNTKDNDRIKIAHGTESNGVVTSSICDFVNKKINSDSNIMTKRLYPMLVELMTNVKQHAYHEVCGKMKPEWYIYTENKKNEIEFVFLDTGVGIPSTIRKNWKEKFKRYIPGVREINSDDSIYLEAVLLGEFRTETKQEHRGKGLPEIYNAIKSKDSRLNKLTIISGHGMCNVSKDGVIEKKSLHSVFEGTLFTWNFEKEIKI